MVEKNMEQQKENMEHLKNLKIEAENKYDAIKQKINQLSDLAEPLKVYVIVTLLHVYLTFQLCIRTVLARYFPNRISGQI